MSVERGTRRARGARAAFTVVIGLVMISVSGCAAVEDALGSESDDTVEEADTTTTTVATTAPVFDQDVYCSLSHEADQLNAAFSDFDDPVALEGFIDDLVGLLQQASPPPEIERQFVVLRTAYVDLRTELQAGGYDSSVLVTSPILSDATVNGAITAVEEHDLALCGPAPIIDDGGGDDTAAGDDAATDPFSEAIASGDFSAMEEILQTEVGRQAFIEGFIRTSPGVSAEQAACFLDNTDIAVLAEMSVNPDELSPEAVAGFLATLETCDIALSAFQTE